ncbi:hypothetical protein TYRP_012087 [Tyrophagus putrescentiae]|nr:hypothetical protein TYRP_012087 [Tyrophagus putrescentiae]
MEAPTPEAEEAAARLALMLAAAAAAAATAAATEAEGVMSGLLNALFLNRLLRLCLVKLEALAAEAGTGLDLLPHRLLLHLVVIKELLQLCGHRYAALLVRLDQVLRVAALLRRDEGVGVALVTGPSCPAAPVHVVLVVIGTVVVHHHNGVLHVQAAGGHRGGHQDVDLAVLEVADGRVAVILVDAAVQRQHRVGGVHQLLQQHIGVLLLVDEDDGAARSRVLAQHFQQLEELVVLLDDHHILLHLLRHHRPPAHLHLDRFVEDAPRERLHDPRKGGAEHDRLPVGADPVDDAHHLRLKAHVEHAVGLIEDDVGAAAEVGHSARVGRQHVDHAARRADDNLRARLQVANLLGDGSAAVDGHHAQSVLLRVPR